HRGGSVGIDGRGRIYATWYTEGTQARPDLYFATSEDGRTFGPKRRLHTSATSIPDHARMAVSQDGRAVIVWEASPPVPPPAPLHRRRRAHAERHPTALHRHQGLGARRGGGARRQLPRGLARGAVPEHPHGGAAGPRGRAGAVSVRATGSRSAEWPRCA